MQSAVGVCGRPCTARSLPEAVYREAVCREAVYREAAKPLPPAGPLPPGGRFPADPRRAARPLDVRDLRFMIIVIS